LAACNNCLTNAPEPANEQLHTDRAWADAETAQRRAAPGGQVYTRWLAAAMIVPILALLPRAVSAAPNRVDTVIGLLEDYCLNKKGEWADLDRRANDAHYAVVMDETAPVKEELSSRQKNWLLPSPDGRTTVLTSMDITNGQMRVFSCGIYAPDLDGDALEKALSARPRLGNPTKHTHPSGGAMMTWWNARVGDSPPSEDSQVMLSRDTPGVPGLGVNLILTTHAPETPKSAPASPKPETPKPEPPK
jgi:hypothetical protein